LPCDHEGQIGGIRRSQAKRPGKEERVVGHGLRPAGILAEGGSRNLQLRRQPPDALCREIADYGLAKAHEQKGYQPQTLSGIAPFINEFFATKAERDRRTAERAARKEQRRKETTLERQKEAYEVYYKTEKLEALEAPLRDEYRTKYPNALVSLLATYVWRHGNEVLQRRYNIPTFGEWQANSNSFGKNSH
jgi:hypothetical protein